MTKGILSDTDQERARVMLREISEHYVVTGKRWYSTCDKVELKRFQVLTRNFTDMEFDMIKQVHGRIKKGA